MSLRVPLVVGGIGAGACACAFLASGLYIFWNSTKLINFLAAWIPFVLSILFAFVPSGKEMKHQWIRWTWRGGVVIVGFFWSVMLWHQQDLSDKANSRQTQDAIGTAVQKASDLANPQFQQVRDQVKEVKEGLKTTESDITSKLDQSTVTISTGLKGVGKPEPPEKPKLIFSFWSDGLPGSDFPAESESLSPDADGNFKVKFAIRNDSSVPAQAIEEWVQICDMCAFAGDQKGFDKPEGMNDHERHRVIPGMNPGVTLVEGNEIEVRIPIQVNKFSMVFKATCNSCAAAQSTKEYWVTRSADLSTQ